MTLSGAGNQLRRAFAFGIGVPRRILFCLRRKRNAITEARRNRRILDDNPSEIGRMQNPLVSICIPTYQRSSVLLGRSVPSALMQTYQNIEIVIVGDGCSSEHVETIEKWLKERGDPRIRFVNLPQRGEYPEDPFYRWQVAGAVPRNKALELSKGEWIAPLDDDDEFTPDHVEVLLRFAQSNGLDFVYGIIQRKVAPEEWENIGSFPLHLGRVCHHSVMYHRRLAFMKYDVESWKYGEPYDWNLWRRMKQAGAHTGFIPRVIGRYYPGTCKNS